MRTIYDSVILSIHFDEANSMLITTIKNYDIVSSEQMKKEITKLSESIEKQKPDYVLNDHTNSRYIYNEKEQIWISRVLGKSCISANVKKTAFVFPDNDIFVEISQQKAAEELNYSGFEIQFFKNVKDAKVWFKS